MQMESVTSAMAVFAARVYDLAQMERLLGDKCASVSRCGTPRVMAAISAFRGTAKVKFASTSDALSDSVAQLTY